MTRTRASVLASMAFCVAAVAAIRSQSAPEARQAAGFSGNNWPTYHGDSAGTHYSTLTQITKANVSRLQVAWTYDTGDRGEYQANNLIVSGVLYTASPTRKVIALNAATGREIWKWDPATLGLAGGAAHGNAAWSIGRIRPAASAASSLALVTHCTHWMPIPER